MSIRYFVHAQPADSKLELSLFKTSSIVFPTSITSVDRGSRDILAQKAKGVDNVLQVKAAKINFRETNLTVITSDGRLHQFEVTYSPQPESLLLSVDSSRQGQNPRLLFNTQMTKAEFDQLCSTVQQNGSQLKKQKRNQMELSLRGVFIEKNVMLFQVSIANDSNIPYHTESLRFFVRDKQKLKRTASQEWVQQPIQMSGNKNFIDGRDEQHVICAIPKFTFPDSKRLIIELMESRGGRHLRLVVKNRIIIKAKRVSEIHNSK